MIAHIRTMVVEKKQWLEDSTFRSGVTLCQMIPGATAMQVTAYVGLQSNGLRGAAASFIGFGLPAFLIMMALSALYMHTRTLPVTVSCFNGLQAIVVAIVAHATFTFGRSWLTNWQGAIIALLAASMFGFGIHPILVILIAALCGFGFDSQQPAAVAVVSKRKSYDPKILVYLLSSLTTAFALLFLMRREWFDLAFLMARIDLFAFGGGFSSLPLMFNEVVHRHDWMDGLTFLNGIALGQITPGPIVITATFIGYLRDGIAGAIIATIFIFLPSFLMLVTMVPYYDRLSHSPYFNRALRGVLYSFVGLLLSVTIRFALNISWDLPRIFLSSGAFATLLFGVELHWIILVGVVFSVLAL